MQPINPARRRLLKGMAALSLSACCATLFPRQLAAQPAATVDFNALSTFLVRRQVSTILSQRYYEALSRHYEGFQIHLTALADYLATRRFAHVDDFLAATPAQTPFFQTAALIIGSWYTGVVGEGAESELIAYADAMMYQPTQGILVVPTYGGGPDSWGDNPEMAKREVQQ
ncbi:sugar dehydrogenase complex small subunit [Kalamiella sp. sgz302252]|uniref:sugar dehydrogenase complex small subunit n=1 Tax=Pantoea sp. sgz302252 TaxID=3341827 RepID=UPI0036D39A09